jgi:hypothetical protein
LGGFEVKGDTLKEKRMTNRKAIVLGGNHHAPTRRYFIKNLPEDIYLLVGAEVEYYHGDRAIPVENPDTICKVFIAADVNNKNWQMERWRARLV